MKHLKPILVTIIILLLTLTVFLTKDSVLAMLSLGQQQKGLVGHWALDNVTGAKDLTPNGNNGTGAGGITIGGATDQRGQASRATAFVGASSQKVTMGNVGNVKSVSFWVNASTTSESFLELIDNSAYISVSAGTISATGLTAPTIYIDNVATTTDFTASAWHLIVVTTGTNVAAASMIIGEANNAYFTGSLADVRVYNRALTATQVTDLYNKYRPKVSVGSLQKGLLGQWKLDQASNKSSTVTADATPYGNNGTGAGSITLGGAQDQHGQASRATTFDGSDDYIDMGTASQINNLSNFAFSFWVNFTDFALDWHYLFGRGYYLQSTTAWYFNYRAASYGMTLFRDDIAVSTTGNYTLSSGTWYHVVITRTSSTMDIYINGSLWGSMNYGAALNETIGETFRISDSRIANQKMKGKMSDLRAYNRALSATEVTSLYNAYRPKYQISSLSKGLALDMPLAQQDLKSATTIADKTPYSNTGTLVGSPTFTTDRHGQSNKAMSFVSGSSQKVTVGNIGSVKSVAFWGKLNSTTEKILELIDDNTYIHNNAGTITATGFTLPTIYVDGAAASTVSDTNWHHIVITTGTAVAAASTTIGEANTTYLTGSIANVKVWNRALSSTEVTSLYNSYRK